MNLCSPHNRFPRQNLNPAKAVDIVLISTTDAHFSKIQPKDEPSSEFSSLSEKQAKRQPVRFTQRLMKVAGENELKGRCC
jgi:hypothetical protein